METYSIQPSRELIKFEIDGKPKEKVLKPLKNKTLIRIQELTQKLGRLENLTNQTNPTTKKSYTFEELEELNDSYEKEIRDLLFKQSFEPQFTDEELEEAETPLLLELMERILKLNGLEKAMAFQERARQGQTLTLKTSQPVSLETLNLPTKVRIT